MKKDLNPGDIVTITGYESPTMTVERVYNLMGDDDEAKCVWFIDGKLYRDFFKVRILNKVNKNESNQT